MLLRYAQETQSSTNRDPFDDIVDLIRFLAARDYLIDLLQERHGIPRDDGRQRATSIIEHVKTGLAFLEQSHHGPIEVSFVPAYYSMLNLLKVYVLVGSNHSALRTQRTHGVSYNPAGKESRDLLNEQIVLHPRGAIPLAYHAITGADVPVSRGRTRTIALSDILPFIADVGFEYGMASRQPSRLVRIDIRSGTREIKGNQVLVPIASIMLSSGQSTPSLRELPVLREFHRGAQPGDFVGNPIGTAGDSDPSIRQQVRDFLLYHPLGGTTFSEGAVLTAVSAAKLYLPEELSIVLLFFYMSSVARYRPEFVAKLRDSRYWPVLVSVRRHGLYKFLLLFLDFVRKETIVLHRL